jgi:hypothetical protein
MAEAMQFQKTPGWLNWYAVPSAPTFKVPAGAVDAHCHVFGPKGTREFARSPDWRTEADRILAMVKSKTPENKTPETKTPENKT